MLSPLSFCPFYPRDLKQWRWRSEKDLPAVQQIYLLAI